MAQRFSVCEACDLLPLCWRNTAAEGQRKIHCWSHPQSLDMVPSNVPSRCLQEEATLSLWFLLTWDGFPLLTLESDRPPQEQYKRRNGKACVLHIEGASLGLLRHSECGGPSWAPIVRHWSEFSPQVGFCVFMWLRPTSQSLIPSLVWNSERFLIKVNSNKTH